MFKNYYIARREHAFILWCEGHVFREIGEHLGISKQQAHNIVKTMQRILQREYHYLTEN